MRTHKPTRPALRALASSTTACPSSRAHRTKLRRSGRQMRGAARMEGTRGGSAARRTRRGGDANAAIERMNGQDGQVVGSMQQWPRISPARKRDPPQSSAVERIWQAPAETGCRHVQSGGAPMPRYGRVVRAGRAHARRVKARQFLWHADVRLGRAHKTGALLMNEARFPHPGLQRPAGGAGKLAFERLRRSSRNARTGVDRSARALVDCGSMPPRKPE